MHYLDYAVTIHRIDGEYDFYTLSEYSCHRF